MPLLGYKSFASTLASSDEIGVLSNTPFFSVGSFNGGSNDSLLVLKFERQTIASVCVHYFWKIRVLFEGFKSRISPLNCGISKLLALGKPVDNLN